MSDDCMPVNTPETLGVTPRYVLQHNAISRSAHNLSATAQKITAMAMALLPSDLSSRTVAFRFSDFCHAVGFQRGGEQFKLFLAALEESGTADIKLALVNPQNGKTTWQGYHWFSFWQYSEETGTATLTFSQELVDVLLELKRVYARINLKDLGVFQSKYALRLYEIAVSYMSLKGKGGNGEREWYFERSIQDLRELFCIPDSAYKEMREFTRRVIKDPIDEINTAGVGVMIKPLRVKQGQKTTGYRFTCEQTARQVPSSKRGKKKAAESPPPLPLDPRDELEREDKELRRLQERYPEEFAELYKTALDNRPEFLKNSTAGEKFAEGRALLELRERHGIVT